MIILPQITPYVPSTKTYKPPTDMQDPFAWMAATCTTQSIMQGAEELLLTSPDAVDDVFTSLPQDTLVVLKDLARDIPCSINKGNKNGWIRIIVGDTVYVMNTRLPALRGIDLGKYPVRFLVEYAYSSSATLKSLGIDRPVHCLGTARFLTAKFRNVPEVSAYKELEMAAALENFWKGMEPSQRPWYKLLCNARPFLTNLKPFCVDTECYISIIDTWRDNESKKGKLSEWEKMLSEFGNRFPVRMKPDAAVTGRFSMAMPSLHSMDRSLRNAFMADEGMTLISGDYHQMQPRIVAEVSGDTKFRKIFEEGRDLYRVWASIFYDKPEHEVTRPERQSFKPVSLAWLYGMQPEKLVATIMAEAHQHGLGNVMTEERAHAGLRAFNDSFPALVQWKTKLGTLSVQQRSVTTYSGRKVPLHEGAYRAACYWAQGTEVEMMLQLVIMIGTKLKEEFSSAYIKLFLHDELILEAPDEIAKHVADLLTDCMTTVFLQSFPNAPVHNLLDIHSGKRWGDLK